MLLIQFALAINFALYLKANSFAKALAILQ